MSNRRQFAPDRGREIVWAGVEAATHIRLVRALGWALALSILWVFVAAVRQETTFHLAPLLVAGTPPVLFALDDPTGTDRNALVVASAAGLAMALAVTAILSFAALLDGPALGGFGNGTAEAVVFAVVGAGLGAVVGGVVSTGAARRAR